MTGPIYITPGKPSVIETLVGLHHNLSWLEDFIRLRGDGRDRPPTDEAIQDIEEYIERAAARLSTPPPSTLTVGSL